jgi:hypothetical protein
VYNPKFIPVKSAFFSLTIKFDYRLHFNSWKESALFSQKQPLSLPYMQAATVFTITKVAISHNTDK